MIALDTNILVRLLVNDPDEQAQNATAKSILLKHGQVYLSQIVQVETIWVSESAYNFDKNEVLKALKHLAAHHAFVLQYPDSFDTALNNFQNSNADFADCLILAESQKQGYQLVTFDKKLGKLTGVHQVK